MTRIGSRVVRKLLVEGNEERRLIPELMKAHGVVWGLPGGGHAVDIVPYDGITAMLRSGEIETQSKTSDLQCLGILVDADDDLEARWQAVRNRCQRIWPSLPSDLPAEGLVHEMPSGIRVGVWIMPDNQARGMMETFLRVLVREEHDQLLRFADDVVAEAEKMGAPFREAHRDKARIHTWLAFQDPPGRQLHDAVKQRIFDPVNREAQQFVDWFRKLFQV